MLLKINKKSDLRRFIDEKKKQKKQIETDLIVNWMHQLFCALKFLHFEKKISHKDLKPE